MWYLKKLHIKCKSIKIPGSALNGKFNSGKYFLLEILFYFSCRFMFLMQMQKYLVYFTSLCDFSQNLYTLRFPIYFCWLVITCAVCTSPGVADVLGGWPAIFRSVAAMQFTILRSSGWFVRTFFTKIILCGWAIFVHEVLVEKKNISNII